MVNSSNICKTELELVQLNDDLNTNKLSKRLNFLCFQHEFCKDRKIFSNSFCNHNCLKLLSSIDNIDEIYFNNEQFTIIFNKNQIDMLKEISEFLKKVNKIKLITNNFNNFCLNHKTCQKNRQIFLDRLFGNYSELGLLESNPLKAFIELKNEIKFCISLIEENKQCKKCLSRFLKNLKKIELSCKKFKIFEKYLNLTLTDKKESFENIYFKIFQFKLIQKEEVKQENFDNNQIIEQYLVEPYLIQIYNNPELEEYIYSYSHSIKLNEIPKNIIKNIDFFNESSNFFNLNELLKYKMQKVSQYLELNYKWSEEDIEKIVKIICFESIGLKRIIPFLLDDFVEEIFLDTPKSNIYIDHSKFGRCSTNIKLNSNDIENLKTRIRLENNSLLDEKHPLLKTDLNTDFFNVRVTCNINPLAVDEINFSIRRLRKMMFSLTELINLNTISIEAAAYLCFLLFHKRSILVIGAPGTGKTTLINSLDILTPKTWRKIYLEDVIESIAQNKYGKHQVRFRVASDSHEDDFLSKSEQVRESLHRTPDMIFIGELIKQETVKAFFFLLKCGLRGSLGTCHSESPELIIQRWLIDDEISPNSISNLDVIVQIAKSKFGRRVIRVAEIAKIKLKKDNFEIIDIFIRDPETDLLVPNFNSFEELYSKSPVLNKIENLLIEKISPKIFNDEISAYIKFFELLINKKIYTLNEIISFFNKFWVLKKNLEINHQFSFEKLTSQLVTLFY